MKYAVGDFRKRRERQQQIPTPAMRTSRLQGNTGSGGEGFRRICFACSGVTGGAVTRYCAVRCAMGIIAQCCAALLDG